MELDNIKSRTTWNDASASINSNFMKVRQALDSIDDELKADIKAKPKEYVPLKTINGLSLYGSGNINVEGGGGGGSEGLTAINVNGESFQPDGNGIVTLPDYPEVPTIPSALPNPKALVIGSKTYDGSSKVTILEDDIVEDIEDIRENASKGASALQSVSSLASDVTSVTNEVSNLKPKVASNEGDIATLKGKMSVAESSITTQGNDIVSLKTSMLKAEEDIADNSDGIRGNAEDISDLDKRLGSIESWYNNVGRKFSKDTDGTIMMDGDFYTTGENSAGGVGDVVGGTGGIDEDEVIEIVNGMGLASKEDLKDKQDKLVSGSNIKTINGESILGGGNIVITQSDTPTSPELRTLTIGNKEYNGSEDVTIVEEDIIADIEDIRNKASLGATALQGVPSEYITETELNRALDGKVDTEDGKVLSDNNYTDADKEKLDSLDNYDDTELKQKVNEVAEDVQAFDDRISDLKEWYDRVGRKIDYDAEEGAVKVVGDFYATGENSAGGAGEAVGGTGGGLDEKELEDYLKDKGYATERWVTEQGFATSEDIPQNVSELTNDSDFITTATADGKYASAEAFNDLEDRVQSIEEGGGTGSGDIDLSDYATKLDLDGKVDKVNGMGLSENNYSDDDKRTLTSLAAWYRDIGNKFTIEGDAVKMDGDFFTTGENSAGGLGESVGSTGGGLDESELEGYLTENKYAKQSWVNQQGFAKGTIPTLVSQLKNDKNYLASITASMVTAALGYTPFNSDNFTPLNIKNTLGISDWALGVTKPAYNYNEIANTPNLSVYVTTSVFNNAMSSKVDKVTGKGLSTNDYTTAEKNLLAGMSSRVDEAEEAVNAMSGIVAAIEEWYKRVSDKIDYDIDEDAIVVTGDLHATGENSAGGFGEDIGDWEDIASRLTTLENSIGNIPSQITQLANKVAALESSVGMQNVEIKVSSLATYDGKSINSNAMGTQYGLTLDVANKMLEGTYNKVIDKTNSSYPSVWNYSAYASSTQIVIMLKQGDGFDVSEGYKLTYTRSSLQWSVFRDLI